MSNKPPIVHMVQPDRHIKILDFGLAKPMSPGRLTRSSMAPDAAYYQAPEQSIHLQELDQRADIYSIGVILYQMLTGVIPIGMAPSPSEEAPDIPRALDAIVARCLKRKPLDRYESVVALRKALDGVVARTSSL